MAKVDTHYRLRDAIERRRFRSRQQVFAYRQWPNLVEYLVVESVAHRLELYRRELDCWWLTITEVATQPLRLEGIGQDLRVTEAFEDLLT